jgi:hypothetical protein
MVVFVRELYLTNFVFSILKNKEVDEVKYLFLFLKKIRMNKEVDEDLHQL